MHADRITRECLEPASAVVEGYLKGLTWSSSATATDKLLVEANIKRFVAWLSSHAASIDVRRRALEEAGVPEKTPELCRTIHHDEPLFFYCVKIGKGLTAEGEIDSKETVLENICCCEEQTLPFIRNGFEVVPLYPYGPVEDVKVVTSRISQDERNTLDGVIC